MAYTYSFGDGRGGVVNLSGNTEQELKSAYVNHLMSTRQNPTGVPVVSGTAPALSQEESAAIFSAGTNKATPEQLALLSSITGQQSDSSMLNEDLTNPTHGTGISPYEGGMTTSSSGQPVPMGTNQAQGAPNESGQSYQLSALSSPSSATGASTGASTGAAPSYAPQSTQLQYNGGSYTPTEYQGPQYQPTDLSSYFDDYAQYLTPGAQEQQLQGDLNNQLAAFRQGIQDVEGQPIAYGFVQGQSAAIEKQASMDQANLQNALALEQNKRLASMDLAKAKLGFAESEADRQMQAAAQSFSQWATTQGLNMNAAAQAFDQWATTQGLNQSQADSAFNKWATEQQLNMQQQQLSNTQSQQQWENQFAQQQYGNQLGQQQWENQFNQQGFDAGQQSDALQRQLQYDQLAQNQSQFETGAQLDYNQQIAGLQEQLYGMQNPGTDDLIEVSGGSTLYNPGTSQAVYTAPKIATPSANDAGILAEMNAVLGGSDTSGSGPYVTAPQTSGDIDWGALQMSDYNGVSVVDYLDSAGLPSDFESRKRMAESLGITNYQGTAEQNQQLLATLQQGNRTYV